MKINRAFKALCILALALSSVIAAAATMEDAAADPLRQEVVSSAPGSDVNTPQDQLTGCGGANKEKSSTDN